MVATIEEALAPAQIQVVKALFREYWNSLGFDDSFQGFAKELAELPGYYVRPGGRLALASFQGEPCGCIALRQFDQDRCEAKRLFVRNAFRGKGIGKQLLSWVIGEAQAVGYSEMLGDTMPFLTDALAMYKKFGFSMTEPYGANPTPGAVYIRLPLNQRGTDF